jgi:MoaA/NifB/PqqE/SkfB family radical SAM enzyme
MRGKTLVEKCSYPWYFLLIDTDGDVRPCCWAATSWLNLNDLDFDEVWNGEAAQTMRRRFLNNDIPVSCMKKHCRVDL